MSCYLFLCIYLVKHFLLLVLLPKKMFFGKSVYKIVKKWWDPNKHFTLYLSIDFKCKIIVNLFCLIDRKSYFSLLIYLKNWIIIEYGYKYFVICFWNNCKKDEQLIYLKNWIIHILLTEYPRNIWVTDSCDTSSSFLSCYPICRTLLRIRKYYLFRCP